MARDQQAASRTQGELYIEDDWPDKSSVLRVVPVLGLVSVISAIRGQRIAFSVRTTAHTACSIAIGYASAPALPPALPNAAGDASWTWIVGRQAPLGTWPITVGCGTGSGKTTISIGA
jgi:hypothetical protein